MHQLITQQTVVQQCSKFRKIPELVFLLAGLTTLSLFVGPADAEKEDQDKQLIHGMVARVVDGDTFDLALDDYAGKKPLRIRIWGVNAPERGELCILATSEGSANGDSLNGGNKQVWPCGLAATTYLRESILNRPITCQVRDHDHYQRTVASCDIAVAADHIDLAEHLLRAGLVTPATGRYAVPRYHDFMPPESNLAEEPQGPLFRGTLSQGSDTTLLVCRKKEGTLTQYFPAEN